jgi:pyruvate dehydrogenase E2 component (dihydrolipoamide acetyltransferase)
MPQMGESIVEGTIVRWLKKVGERVDRDEPLFEITTDKVEAEIPSPAAGVLTDITAHEGQTVSVNTVVGIIQQDGEVPSAETPVPPLVPVDPAPAAPRAEAPAPTPVTQDASAADRRPRSSPLVRRIAREHGVDISTIEGSGIGGRVTKQDILGHIARSSGLGVRGSNAETRGSGLGARDSKAVAPDPAPGARDSGLAARSKTPGSNPESRMPNPERRISIPDSHPLSPMRKKIAEHMVLSRDTAVHVHTVFHVDFSRVAAVRREKKAEYERMGVALTYMAFIAKAVSDTLRHHPLVNALLDGDNVVYSKDVNLGIAVALESGLIVPVIHQASEKNLLGLSKAIADVAERARAKQLKPEEVHGGTFTVTNPGHFGAQFGTPIINQPQSAILGVGTIEKRPVVIGDGIAIRTMAYLTLGFDHRLIDGAVADQFMADVKKYLEAFDSDQA